MEQNVRLFQIRKLRVNLGATLWSILTREIGRILINKEGWRPVQYELQTAFLTIKAHILHYNKTAYFLFSWFNMRNELQILIYMYTKFAFNLIFKYQEAFVLHCAVVLYM